MPPTPSANTENNPVLPSFDMIAYFALILAVLIFYGNIYDNALLYDDEYLIQKNQYLRSWLSISEIFTHFVTDGAHRAGLFYRPLQNLLYLIVYQIGGVALLGFYLFNVFLHATNACLVYALGRKLKFQTMAVFFTALIWALHPIHVEAVTYMSATADTLSALFCLLG